ncbi:hypothetical protein HMPREF2829_09100 [Aerococcus sp. HMSC072A12]|nr:hypothetical protein HMPREF2829_09100 [Aerococcus sp. HMSC072A12]OFR32458.1 hypothetical protein HMPREF2892_08600 [Aerococcus sp. HMSC061A03]OFT42618.1 hypothetical protein HMPREF3161_02050 [Aerococcus sp. HMSC06H08]
MGLAAALLLNGGFIRKLERLYLQTVVPFASYGGATFERRPHSQVTADLLSNGGLLSKLPRSNSGREVQKKWQSKKQPAPSWLGEASCCL